MATSLHQQLKAAYAERFGGSTEVSVERFRIDVRAPDRLYEIQQAGLAALRDKTRRLIRRHDVTIVKPIVRRKRLVRLETPAGPVLSSRSSPKRGVWWHAFRELIALRSLFPHRRLAIDLVLVDIDELRVPKPRRRFRGKDFEVIDRVLTEVVETRSVGTIADVASLLPGPLPECFDTGALAEAWGIARHETQTIAYFLREIGAIAIDGKQGRSLRYRTTVEKRSRSTVARRKRTKPAA
jgi:hypothetical protein